MTLRGLVLALFGLALPVMAQAQDATGPWQCEWGFQNTAPGVPANAVGGQFQMMIHPNGTAQGQGFDSSTQSPMAFQAQWGFEGRTLRVIGQQTFANGWPSQQFNFMSNFVGADQLAITHTYANGQVYASRCIRLQG